MSFILEALKKSEQQRQQNAALTKKVGARRLSLNPHNSPHRPYWLLITVLLLLMLGSWWHFSESGSNQENSLVVERVERPLHAINQFDSAKQAAGQLHKPVLQPTPVVEAAPVPRTFTRPATTGKKAPSARMTQSGIITTEVLPSQEELSALPLYSELSKELRERMPRLDMSMHFYTSVSTRRLVRMNNRLLREGDWVNGEVEIVEITPNGVILDFLGKGFKLRSKD